MNILPIERLAYEVALYNTHGRFFGPQELGPWFQELTAICIDPSIPADHYTVDYNRTDSYPYFSFKLLVGDDSTAEKARGLADIEANFDRFRRQQEEESKKLTDRLLFGVTVEELPSGKRIDPSAVQYDHGDGKWYIQDTGAELKPFVTYSSLEELKQCIEDLGLLKDEEPQR